ncbi:MAG TPA: hypothetical protein VN736_06865 [Candidatus Limnocylindrales bacterium]|nr:hypothetical protein [Candidatus Limnocylindrales bacterium]
MRRWLRIGVFVVCMLAVLLMVLTAVRVLPESQPAPPVTGVATVNFEWRFLDSILAAFALLAAALGSAVLLRSRSAAMEVVAGLAAAVALLSGARVFSLLEVSIAVTVAAGFVLLARNLAGGRR